MIYNNEEILMLKKLSIITFSLGDDFICNSNLFDHCREVQFDCPEETEDSYFLIGREKSLPLIRASWGVLGAETDNCYVW